MPAPSTTWFESLPKARLLAEFSMWSADLARLADDLARIAPHADMLHIDVADGHFAPALLFFPDLLAAMRKHSSIPVHVHLMVADHVLISQADQFAEAGADLISIHAENANAAAALAHIKAKGLKAGVVLKVETPVSAAAPLMAQTDILTLLGTAIGVKGQGLNDKATARLGEAKALIARHMNGSRIILAADGGIREHTVPELRMAGAETVVLGSLAFGAPDLAQRMAWLKSL
ncbi:MAG: ribulose-phosphate 3-epimerase [Hyphomicrobiales bacterium]